MYRVILSLFILLLHQVPTGAQDSISLQKNYRSRTSWVAAANVAGYGGTMVALYRSWYLNYPRSPFHTFNDMPEWKQADKAGHLYSAYIQSSASTDLWKWAGMNRKTRIWVGGLSGTVYQTAIEILDGFSADWGWSWGDIGANVLGSGTYIAQALAWDEQRIRLKFSFHRKNYNDPTLDLRSDQLFGSGWSERMLKDYNGQTYWASVRLAPFFTHGHLPPWLSLAVGYGAEGLFGGRDNIATNSSGTVTFDRRDRVRVRQWYLSPDIDWTQIKTNKKAVSVLLTFLNAFKFPAPTLMFSNGKWKVIPLYF
ncbi:MAG: DUF2279 domain-containing protein [Sphingomonadales bacterium]|nr:DUF2279 domain-containing protein [Sphingomonadales bacterium]